MKKRIESLLHEALGLYFEVTDDVKKLSFAQQKYHRVRAVMYRIEETFGRYVKEGKARHCYRAMNRANGLMHLFDVIDNRATRDNNELKARFQTILDILEKASELERDEIAGAIGGGWWQEKKQVTGLHNTKELKRKTGTKVTQATFIEILNSRFKKLQVMTQQGTGEVKKIEQEKDRFKLTTGIGTIEIEYDSKFPVKYSGGTLTFFKAL